MGKAREARQIAEAAEAARLDRLEIAMAEETGRTAALAEMCTWLQERFMAPDVEIDSAEGKALRTIAGDLVEHFSPSARIARDGSTTADPDEEG